MSDVTLFVWPSAHSRGPDRTPEMVAVAWSGR